MDVPADQLIAGCLLGELECHVAMIQLGGALRTDRLRKGEEEELQDCMSRFPDPQQARAAV